MFAQFKRPRSDPKPNSSRILGVFSNFVNLITVNQSFLDRSHLPSVKRAIYLSAKWERRTITNREKLKDYVTRIRVRVGDK